MAKIKLALYWASSCGGCEIAQLEIGTKLLKLIEVADIVFWPVAIDVKYKDVEAMPEGSIDVCLFNGGIRTSEQEHMAKMLRGKSKILISYGACANYGGIPGMANLFNRDMILNGPTWKPNLRTTQRKYYPRPAMKHLKERCLCLNSLIPYAVCLRRWM